MKKALITSLIFATAASAVSAQITYSQFFNNNNQTFIDSQSSLYNWNFATANNIATVANDISAGNTKSSSEVVTGEVTRGRGFFFLLPSVGTEGAGATFMYTTNTAVSNTQQNNPQPDWFSEGADPLTGNTLADTNSISYRTRVGSAGNFPSRVAIQVGGDWYLSSTSFALSATSTWETSVLSDLVNETWIEGAFDGVNLDDDVSDNTTTLLSGTDVITGYGMYADVEAVVGGASRIRMDQMVISAVPEPSAYALLAGSLTALVLFARRRK